MHNVAVFAFFLFGILLAGVNFIHFSKREIMKKVNQDRMAKSENIIYKDKNVTVSKLSLQVGQALYPLEHISECRVASISPNRKPALSMMVVGAILAGVAHRELIPANIFHGLPPLEGYGYSLSYVKLTEGIGTAIAVIGIFAMIIARTLYSLRVDMEGNVMDAIVTRKRDYVKKIAVAVGIGLRNIPSKPTQKDNKSVQPPYTYSEVS